MTACSISSSTPPARIRITRISLRFCLIRRATSAPKDFALLALQGPEAAAVMEAHAPGSAAMPFMTSRTTQFDDIWVQISRSGYTGEDGFEISVKQDDAVRLWDTLLADERVRPIGLGARDSLRLEAGLCLYGHDIDQTTSPVEGALAWSIQKRRRDEGGFPGAARILGEIGERSRPQARRAAARWQAAGARGRGHPDDRRARRSAS